MIERRGKVLPRVRLALALVCSGLALGCTSPATPERSYYLLRGDSSTVLPAAAPELRAGIGQVEIAPYLDRAGIVLGLGLHEVREARFHLWAEPLQRGIHYYLEEQISSALGYRVGGGPAATRTWQKRVDIGVLEFHGDQDGAVRLVADVAVTSASGEVLAVERFSAVVQQSGEGYPALVAAQVGLLGALAEAIAPLLR